MGKKKSKDKQKKKNQKGLEVWTEDQYEEYLAGLYGLESIAGYTSNGFPFGSMLDEEDHFENPEKHEQYSHKSQLPTDDDIPF